VEKVAGSSAALDTVDRMTTHMHDCDDMCPACVQPWLQAGSVSRLRELTARFIEGTLHAQPNYLAGAVAPETEGLVGVLAAINRAGLLTDGSQPGGSVNGFEQRAWVSDYATDRVVDSVLAGTLSTDVMVLALPPGITEGPRVCVTRAGARECTWAGAFEDPRSAYGTGSRSLDAQLARLWCVDIIDPEWGREDLLWATVHAALTARPGRQYFLPPGIGHGCNVHS
jgi:hypothetical protein